MRRMMVCLVGLGALSLASCAGRSEAQRAYGYGPRWEYRAVRVDEAVERDLTAFLNAQAADGWEYVGPITGKDEHLIFRRPAPGRPMGVTAVGEPRGTPRVIRRTRMTTAVAPQPLPP